ncbi:hypothetical protein TRVA0_049S00628 [Trichomonascus vanleenenianus]|uniref:Rso55p n=1 Tax=Trichomonascus vanleenenianus TaxID=2268995 RepID=UPI003ECB44F2
MMIRVFRRSFSRSCISLIKKHQFPPRPKISEDDIEEVFIKGGGKGGQKINKTNSKVQLKHIPTGIVISSQHSRSREDNRRKARELLALKIEELENPGESRTAIIANYKQTRERKKKSRSKKKYKELEEKKLKEKDEDPFGGLPPLEEENPPDNDTNKNTDK